MFSFTTEKAMRYLLPLFLLMRSEIGSKHICWDGLVSLRSETLEVCDIISVTQYLLLLGWVSSKVAITSHMVSAPSDYLPTDIVLGS